MRQEQEIPKRLVIKNSKFGFSDLFYLGLFLFLVYIAFQIEELIFSLIMLIAMTGFVALKIVQRLKDDTEQIVIDEDGITLKHINSPLIKWKNIKFAYIKQAVSGKSVVDRLYVETTSEELIIGMSDFSYNSSLLTRCINHYSGRKIGHISNKLNYGISHLLKDKKMLDELYPLFNAYFKRQQNIYIPFFLLLAIFVFLQFVITFPYIFAIGWSVSIFILAICGFSEEKRLHNKEPLRNLDKETIKKISKEYGKEFGYPTSETFTIFAYAFLVLFTIVIFLVSYILSNL